MSLMPFQGKCFHCGHDHGENILPPIIPKPADEQPVEKRKFADGSQASPVTKARRFIEHLANKKSMLYFFDDGFPKMELIYQDAEATLDVIDQMTAPRPADPDLLALVDELEEAALQKHEPSCWKHILEGRECSCDARKQHTKVLELTARLRAALGNTESSR